MLWKTDSYSSFNINFAYCSRVVSSSVKHFVCTSSERKKSKFLFVKYL